METTERIAQALEVEDHGVDHCQYFPGAGLAFTDYEDCATGTGNTPREALEDALEALACSGWTLSEELEAQALEELGDAEHADRDYVSEEEARGEEEALPALEWSVSFHAWSGCSPSPHSFEDRADARREAAETLRARRATGHPVSILERGARWEVQEPEGCAMVPDTCGTLSLESNEEEREEERERLRDLYPSELYYYVSVRIR